MSKKNQVVVHMGKNQKKKKSNRSSLPRAPAKLTSVISETWAPLFPPRVTRKLRFSDTFALTSTSGAVGSYVFSANGLFDPNVSGGAHQPMGFDQMMISYNHYAVLESRIMVIFKNQTSSAPTVSISVCPSATPITSINRILEYGNLSSRTLEYKSVSGSIAQLTESANIRKLQGVNNIVDDTSLQGDAAANPAEQHYYVVQMWDTTALNGSAQCDVVIEFTAVFLEPRVMTESLASKLKVVGFFDQKTN